MRRVTLGLIIGFGLAMVIAHLNGLNTKPWEKS